MEIINKLLGNMLPLSQIWLLLITVVSQDVIDIVFLELWYMQDCFGISLVLFLTVFNGLLQLCWRKTLGFAFLFLGLVKRKVVDSSLQVGVVYLLWVQG